MSNPRPILAVDFAEIEARVAAHAKLECRLTGCHEKRLPKGFLCFSHEMQYVIKYGRPSERDARLRGLLGTYEKILAI